MRRFFLLLLTSLLLPSQVVVANDDPDQAKAFDQIEAASSAPALITEDEYSLILGTVEELLLRDPEELVTIDVPGDQPVAITRRRNEDGYLVHLCPVGRSYWLKSSTIEVVETTYSTDGLVAEPMDPHRIRILGQLLVALRDGDIADRVVYHGPLGTVTAPSEYNRLLPWLLFGAPGRGECDLGWLPSVEPAPYPTPTIP